MSSAPVDSCHRSAIARSDYRDGILPSTDGYAGAVSLDPLKTEMDQLTRAMATAERQVEASQKHVAKVEDILDQALAVQC